MGGTIEAFNIATSFPQWFGGCFLSFRIAKTLKNYYENEAVGHREDGLFKIVKTIAHRQHILSLFKKYFHPQNVTSSFCYLHFPEI